MSAQEVQSNGEAYEYDGIDGEDPRGPPEACLFVASLPTEVSEESLKEFFTVEGKEPIKIKLMKDRTDRLKNYAFVQYSEVELANQAILMAVSNTFEGKKVRVERAKVNRTLFIAKMEKSISSTQLRTIVEAYGPVDNVTIIKNHQTNKSKGCGFVKFLHREHATNAYNGLKSTQKRWIIEWATSNNDPETLGIDRNNIFVGGLNPINITKEEVEKRFGAHGKIESISLVNKELEPFTDEESGEVVPRSAFAFIRYADPSSSALAIEQENGVEWNDRRIRVQYCESQDMKNKRRANKYFSSMAQFSSYFPPAHPGMPMSFPPQFMGGYPMVHNPMVFPQQPYYYPNMQVRGEMAPPVPASHSVPNPNHKNQPNSSNGIHSKAELNGIQQRQGNTGKMNVNTLPYQPQMQFQPQLMHYQQNFEHQELDHESSALVNSLTAISLDRAPRW
eukprot:TRINITY_DN5098_c0_g1_i1.p1 TRINITY_DN5098_c0_g1~~TRINITY_DN5098_c0_g1_i1.p1  ORF type:complete len:448 (-),score=145.12 TRINITY_DN5098_c0_g1_i1:1293-2636(-)